MLSHRACVLAILGLSCWRLPAAEVQTAAHRLQRKLAANRTQGEQVRRLLGEATQKGPRGTANLVRLGVSYKVLMSVDIASFTTAIAENSRFPLTRERLGELSTAIQEAVPYEQSEPFPSLERKAQEPKALPPPEPDIINSFLDGLANELRDVRVEIRTRASRAFAAALAFGVIGAMALFVGIGFLLSGTTTAGVLSSIGAVLTGLFSGIFAKLYMTASGDLQSILSDLSLIERVRVRVLILSQMKDAKKRDDGISAIVADLGSGVRTRRASAK